MRDPNFIKFPTVSSLRESGKKIRISPIVSTKTVKGSKTKAIANSKKYSRKKRPEENSPVENTISRTTIIKVTTLKALLRYASLAFFLLTNDIKRYKKIKKPIICIV